MIGNFLVCYFFIAAVYTIVITLFIDSISYKWVNRLANIGLISLLIVVLILSGCFIWEKIQ